MSAPEREEHLRARRAASARATRRQRILASGLLACVIVAAAMVSEGLGEDRDAAKRSQGHRERAASGQHRSSSRPSRPGPHLRPGSDPGVLPGPVLIADRDNNRLIEVSPSGRILWRFPPKRGLPAGQSFKLPDDAFFSPSGRRIVATQEDDFAISVIGVPSRRIDYRYGHPGVFGSAAGYLHNPDDAMLTPSGKILSADIKNCRLVVITPPSHTQIRQLGTTTDCLHDPGVTYASPNGAFPMHGGRTAVTEITGDWLDVLSPKGKPLFSTHPPDFSYPSDTNEVRPGLFLSADYTSPGAIETFTSTGVLRWLYEPTGSNALDHPSLALPLPNGDVLANDDRNDRVIVIDPHTNRIVWQYGHTGVPGAAPGFLSNPDGVDLAPPHSLTMRFASTFHAP